MLSSFIDHITECNAKFMVHNEFFISFHLHVHIHPVLDQNSLCLLGLDRDPVWHMDLIKRKNRLKYTVFK
ncbi:hypothetical protein GDO81_004307 [Engystomops pustulosus]|uniref:HIT domain-containing protein n=1 Tax=Engystomops pustulosus TaxID=76066 RepID=A0AAV6ZRG4_ENGPU|nr:hypothetical protein GDO81_004307 [Engystomops pustulosus]